MIWALSRDKTALEYLISTAVIAVIDTCFIVLFVRVYTAFARAMLRERTESTQPV